MLLLFYYKFHVINSIYFCYSHDVRGDIQTGNLFLLLEIDVTYISITRKFLSMLCRWIRKSTEIITKIVYLSLNYSNSITFFFLITDIKIYLDLRTCVVYTNYYLYKIYLRYVDGICWWYFTGSTIYTVSCRTCFRFVDLLLLTFDIYKN